MKTKLTIFTICVIVLLVAVTLFACTNNTSNNAILKGSFRYESGDITSVFVFDEPGKYQLTITEPKGFLGGLFDGKAYRETVETGQYEIDGEYIWFHTEKIDGESWLTWLNKAVQHELGLSSDADRKCTFERRPNEIIVNGNKYIRQ